MITWLFPGLLAGLGVCAAPVLIHWLLRPRPRRQVFPAMRLLRAAHSDGMRRQRVSHWLLLLVRTLLLLAVVLGAARPIWRVAGGIGGSAPVAVVICLDDSASMNYHTPRGTRRDAAIEWAESLLLNHQRFPDGSRFLVLTGSTREGAAALGATPAASRGADAKGTSPAVPDAATEHGNAGAKLPAAWTSDRGAATRALHVPPPGPHDRGVRAMLDKAAVELAGAGETAKEIYLLTDMAAHAWGRSSQFPVPSSQSAGWIIDPPSARADTSLSDANVPSSAATIPSSRNAPIGNAHAPTAGGSMTHPTPMAAQDVACFVLDVGQPENRNASIVARWPAELRGEGGALRVPPGRPTTVSARVTTGDEPADGQVELWLDGAIVGRSDVLSVAAKSARDAAVRLPALSTGVHFGELRLDRADRLADDNSAYFVIDVAPRVRVAVLSPDDVAPPHVEARRIAAMLAPESLPEERRPFDVMPRPASAIETAEIEEARLIVWVEPSAVTTARVERLRQLCEAGRTVLIVAGPRMNQTSWLRADAAGRLGAVPTGVAAPPAALEFAADASDAGAASLRGHAVYRYARLEPRGGAAVTLQLANGDAAAVEARMGRGRVLWWAFSLRPEWSDLGVRAAPILLRLHALARAAWPEARRASNAYCDEPASVLAPPGLAAARVTRLAPGPAGGASTTVRVAPGGAAPMPTRVAGLYRVTAGTDVLRDAASGSRDPGAVSSGTAGTSRDAAVASPSNGPTAIIAGGAVNLRPRESDARRMSDDMLRAQLGPARVTVHHRPAEVATRVRGAARQRAMDAYLLVAALALLFLEAGLARAAYRPAAAGDPPGT